MTNSSEQNPADNFPINDNEPQQGIWPFVLPFVVYMLIASRAPSLDPASIDDAAVNQYFYLVIAQVVVAAGLVLFFIKSWLREFPFRVDIWGFVAGIAGVVLWVGMCALGLEQKALNLVGLGDWMPERVGFNPFVQITDPSRRLVFLIFRFTLLAAMVPIIEELFLRGWLVRYIENPAWHTVKLSDVGKSGIIAVAVYGLATHPGEAVAAVVWFTMVTILMIKTGKFWNCVVAHAVTNLLLGIYVVYASQWHLW